MKRGGVIEVLAAVRGKLDRALTGYHKVLHRHLVDIYKIALYLRECNDSWVDFCTDAFWNDIEDRHRPRVGDRTRVLGQTIRFVFGYDGPATTKRVSDINTALKPFYERNDKPSTLEHRLDEAGLTGLIDESRKARRSRKDAHERPLRFTVNCASPKVTRAIMKNADGSSVLFRAKIKTIKPENKIAIDIIKIKT